jgi:hypothetical protein
MTTEALRRGDLVEVLGPSEILATLDERGALGGLPFMPEMVPSCGRRFRVVRRAEKLCDTVTYLGSRKMHDAVILDDGRCSGDGHDGCQAECIFYWKEAWLRRVEPGGAPGPAAGGADGKALLARVAPHVRYEATTDGKVEQRYFCQVTELLRATERLAYWDPRPMLRELTSGNVPLGPFLKVAARAAVTETRNKLGLYPKVHVPGTRTTPMKDPPLNLQPGEFVRVKSLPGIAATLGPDGRNRGLWFDKEPDPAGAPAGIPVHR